MSTHYHRLSSTERGYGAPHQRLRRSWVPRVEAGEVACGRCGRLIAPGSFWDLSHPADIKRADPVPWHRSCNRSYAATVTKRRGRKPAHAAVTQAPIVWSRVWGTPPPQGYILASDPTRTVVYPD